MSESLMGGRSDDRSESWRMLADLQDRIDTARAEEGGSAGTAKDMLDDLQRRVGEREGGAVLSGAGQDAASRSTSQDELDKLNGRVVRRGEQPGEASF